MTGDESIAFAWCGPDQHGITRFGRELAGAARTVGYRGHQVCGAADLAELVARFPGSVRLVHLQVNDWMFGGGGAAPMIEEFAAQLDSRGARLSVTLHDLPHRADTAALYDRRARTYAAICAAAVGVVVASDYERDLLVDAIVHAAPALEPPPITVIPLPINRDVAAGDSGQREPRTVGVFGFLYPGKGHREVITALTGLNPPVELLAIGRPSAGHQGLVVELSEHASRLGVGFRVTGFVTDEDVPALLASVDVPVAPAPQVSASASINSWIGAGRRPLTLAGGYTRELAGRSPGAVVLYEDGSLRHAVERALADPALTVPPPGFVPSPTLAQVAGAYVEQLRAWSA